MAYNGRYSIAIRILLLKKYLEANAGRNRYVTPQEIHDFLKEYELDVEKKALYADFAVLGTSSAYSWSMTNTRKATAS